MAIIWPDENTYYYRCGPRADREWDGGLDYPCPKIAPGRYRTHRRAGAGTTYPGQKGNPPGTTAHAWTAKKPLGVAFKTCRL